MAVVQEKESFLRRIISGKFYATVSFHNEDYLVLFQDPSLDILIEADWRYKNLYNDYLKQDGITLEQSFKILEESGKWSGQLEQELAGLYTDIRSIQENIETLRFKKAEYNAAQKTIEKGKNRIRELEITKHQLWPSTIEYMADKAKRRFIVGKVAKILSSNVDPDLFNVPTFLDTLVVYYYEESSIPEKIVREIARTDPWRVYWTVGKNTGTPLFPHSAVEMTEYQSKLVMWSQLYDFAYQCPNRPPDDTILNDDAFDSWYRSEINRLDSEIAKNFKGAGLNKGQSGDIFIVADREGAKEVYDLNDQQAKIRLAQRNKAIKEKGVVTEANLPDVKKDLIMQANKAAMESVRSK